MRWIVLSLACCCSLVALAQGDPHTITSGKLTATFTPEAGMTAIALHGTPLWNGSTASVAGTYTTLLQVTPANAPARKPEDTDLTRNVGTMTSTDKALTRTVTVIAATPTRYCVRHAYESGLTFTFDHLVQGPDVTCRVIIENDTPYDYQLTDWMPWFKLTFDDVPEQYRGTGGGGYPAGDVYSPVTALWGKTAGIGISWIEHRCRPVRFRINATSSRNPTKDRNGVFNLWLSPTAAGGRNRYAVVFRVDDTPKDWKHLLTPYKTWFNGYFGDKAHYNVDFRIKLMNTPSNGQLIKPDNPFGTRGKIDTEGWEPFIKERMGGIAKYPGVASHIVFWSILADPRGVNYRPDFNVMPPVTRETLPRLRQWCRDNNMGFGWFARPNCIAFKRTWDQDAGITWNPLEPWQVQIADERYLDLVKQGCTSFYMDTYGNTWERIPGGAEGNVAYLRHLRELLGPDNFFFIEHGFDAQHLYAPIWPPGGDAHGKSPFDEYARWLCAGTVEICRVNDLEGAKRAWEGGAIPFALPLNDELVALQKRYVQDDWTSVKRPDCPAAKSPVPGPEEQYVTPEKPAEK